MKNLALTYFFILYALTLIGYYLIGGSQFPDYENYLILSDYSASQKEKIYFTEFLTQIILSSNYFKFNELNNVDSLAIFVQIFIFIIFVYAIYRKAENIYPVILFSSLYLPLFLTTTLRAAPLYALFFVVSLLSFRYEIKFKSLILFAMAGSLFHDSFILIGIVFFFAIVIQKSIKLSIKRCYLMLVMAILILLIGPSLKHHVLSYVNIYQFGERSGYIQAEKFSAIKLIYILFFIFISFLYLAIKNNNINQKYIVSFLALSLCVVYIASDTIAIRYSIFIAGYFIAVNNGFVFVLERRLSNFLFIMLIYFCLFLIQFKALL